MLSTFRNRYLIDTDLFQAVACQVAYALLIINDQNVQVFSRRHGFVLHWWPRNIYIELRESLNSGIFACIFY